MVTPAFGRALRAALGAPGRLPRALRLLLLAVVALAGAAAAAPALGWQWRQVDGFPHDKHARVFPTCEGCHAGITTGDRVASFPDSSQCSECHTGADLRKVTWPGPTPRPSNLRFTHVEHAREAGAPRIDECGACHQQQGGRWMQVVRGEAEQCITCHGHQAPAHFATEAPCQACHVPVARATSLPLARVARFPTPPSHARPDFLVRHGVSPQETQAQCATCHAQESCARCHVNAATLRQVTALEKDRRIATLVASKPATYPVPPSHTRPGFQYDHGRQAQGGIATCANCHAQSSCRTCHLGESASRTIAQLPRPRRGAAQGVRLEGSEGNWGQRLSAAPGAAEAAAGGAEAAAARRAAIVQQRDSGVFARGGHPSIAGGVSPDSVRRALAPGAHLEAPDFATGERTRRVRVHWPGFERNHGAQAAAGQMNCASCHSQRFCADCHEGESRRRYHQANFVQRHAADSYGRERDCAQCHNTEVFCRTCHEQSGLASRGRLDVAFHTGQPLWLLQHGRAARQSMQSCTSCHTQRDCMQCHAQGGQGINPHGPGFDARRQWERNRLTCLRCHLTDPFGARNTAARR